jgi:enediyne biosynthesis protein E4
MSRFLRANVTRAAAVAIVALCAALTRLPSYSAAERATLAQGFSFERLPLAIAARPLQTSRTVEPSLRRISAWISAVGAAVSLSDLDGIGLPNDVCLVDPRSNRVTVAPAPGTGARYKPFTLDASPLPYDAATMAPMGCLPGDFNEDGRTDLLVYYWGRTPVLFLRRPSARLDAQAFVRQELVTPVARWYTDTITSADVDGDGHPDLFIGNYFPDGARVLDARARSDPAMQMQDSMSRAYNGGGDRLLLWHSRGKGSPARVQFTDVSKALPRAIAHGWTLALAAADLNGDLLPELYIANDFGPDHLLYNESTPGHIHFRVVTGRRGLTTPASKVLGRDSFKGMGVDFGDLNGDGRLDIFVSNITSQFALEESNFAFIATGSTAELAHGRAPFVDQSEPLGVSRSGWAWDAKIGDFNDAGVNEIVQATGFVRGSVNRWPELQELAMANDTLLHHQSVWPRFRPGDDLSGHQHKAFFVRGPAGRFVDLADAVGLGGPVVSRGIATGDVNGDGLLDLAVADQWAPSYLYLNRAPGRHRFLGLRLLLPPAGTLGGTRVLGRTASHVLARAATGAEAVVHLPGGRTLIGQVDGGNGHASVRAPELLFGLGGVAARRLRVAVAWRDGFGVVRHASLVLQPGWHTILLAQGHRS